jgi:hypothetical protein
MKRNTLISIVVLGTLAVAVAFGAVAYKSASAKTITTAVNNFAALSGNDLINDADPDDGLGGGQNDEYLAKALGITVDELNAAYTKAQEAALVQAVEKGLITQTQADQLKSKGDVFPFGGRWAGWLSQNGIDFKALLADALGISAEQLDTALLQAFNARIDQAVADGKMTQEQADLAKGWHALQANSDYQGAMQAAFEAAVKQAVADGVITQAQAELILQNAAERGMGGFPGMNGRGKMDGFGGGRGHGRPGQQGAPIDPAAPQPPATP